MKCFFPVPRVGGWGFLELSPNLHFVGEATEFGKIHFIIILVLHHGLLALQGERSLDIPRSRPGGVA